ncbi:something about silencing protein 10 [Rhodotorula kratochvilovae]
MAKPKMTGARKATNHRAKAIAPEQAFDPRASRSARHYDSYESVMDGDEDQFHLNRDKMLLDDGPSNRRGGADDDDALDEPDTVYDLDLPSASGSDASDDDQDEAEDEEDAAPKKRARKEYKRPDKNDATKGRYGHAYDPKQDVVFPSSDDESGSGASDDDDEGAGLDAAQLAGAASDDEEEGGKEGADAESDEDEDRWAAGHYHVSRRAPGEADSEDDEALELEEAEARRLQKKARERMSGGDYGVEEEGDDGEEAAKGEERLRLDGDEDDAPAAEKEGVDAAQMGEAEAIAHLLKTQPETLALVDDFVLTASKIQQVARDLEVVRQGDGKGGEHPALAIMELEHQALTTYLPALAFYFSLLLAPSPAPPQLVEKVLARLSSLRERLATMEELDLTSTTYGAEEDEEDDEELGSEEEEERAPRRRGAAGRGMLASEAMDFHASLAGGSDEEEDDSEDDSEGEEVTDSMLAGLDDDELEALMGQLGPGEGAEELMARVRAKQAEKLGLPAADGSEGEEESEEEDDDEEEQRRIAAARAAKRAAKKSGGTAAIPALAPLSRSSSSSAAAAPRASASAASDLLDPLALSASDRADKASQRHTLRFHVSQVAQKAARREARRQGLEGDDDVPRRSKEQARREVLKRQEHGAAKDAQKRAALDGGEFDDEDRKAAKAVREEGEEGGAGGGADDDDDYYDLVAAEKDEGRRAKKAKYDDARAAEKAEIEQLAAASVDGPRGASRQILANKGLTPKRKKENRNARVKKRRQYDDKKKKLRSMQAQYGGGEARTGYEGERSGISRQTVKSVKLG